MLGKVDKNSWQNTAQQGELRFHSNLCKTHPDYPLEKISRDDMAWIGLDENALAGKRVLDIGCGPIVKGLYFKDAYVIASDPLLNEYVENVTWNRIGQTEEQYPFGSETFIPTLENTVDVIVSRNALDHGYDFDISIANMYRYLVKGGKAYLEFDIHMETDKLHQMQMTPDFCESVFLKYGFKIIRHIVEPKKRNLGDAHFYELEK